MKTPPKKEKSNIDNDKDNCYNNYSMNITNKANSEIKALLLNEKNINKNKENKNINIKIKNAYSIQKKRSDLTTGITGSKTDSSDGKKFMINKIKMRNIILIIKIKKKI